MEKKQHQKNRTGKKRGKKPVARIRSLSRSRKLQKKISIKKPIKTGKKTSKKRSIKKPIFKKPAAFKKRPKKQGLLRRPKNATKPEVPFIDSEKLPDRYNSTDVTLMVRDPYWIHAFWETTPSSVREVQKKIGAPFKKSVYTLRVHDITISHSNEENSRASFDIDVDPKARNWYINLWRDNVTYFADFGIRTPKGAFYPLARSNTVTTPRATMSEMPDVTWMKVEGRGTYSYVNYPAARQETPKQEIPASASGRKKFAGDKPTVPVMDFPTGKTQSAFLSQMDSSLTLLKPDSVSAGELPSTDFAGLLVPEPSTPKVLGGSSAYMGGASERLQSQRDFFFDLNTELVVYGRTESGAVVWMGTNKIAVGEDGSFSLRCALPEGTVPLDFTAQSLDKSSTRTIITAVRRTPTGYL
jgi:uncharacterized protein